MFQFWLSFAHLWQICVSESMTGGRKQKNSYFYVSIGIARANCYGKWWAVHFGKCSWNIKVHSSMCFKAGFLRWVIRDLFRGQKRIWVMLQSVTWHCAALGSWEREAVQIWVSCSCTSQGTTPWLQCAVGDSTPSDLWNVHWARPVEQRRCVIAKCGVST